VKTPAHLTPAQLPPRRHLLTVAVEDYFQVVAFKKLIDANHWHRFEQRIERNTQRTLDLLDEFGVKATFFTLGWVADEMPEVVRAIAARGHEVASKGYLHRTIQDMTPGEFREDVQRAREAIERASGTRVVGYRIARGHLGLADLWALDVLAEEGFAYDSSFYPRMRSIAAEPWRRFPFKHPHAGAEIAEFPLATWEWNGRLFPIAGGAYLRQLPHALVSRALDGWHRKHAAPMVMYFHIWELDPDLPQITAATRLARLRQYRNLDQMPARLRYYMSHYAFEPIRDRLGLAAEPAPVRARAELPTAPAAALAPGVVRTPVTLVVPCFNEQSVLPYLRNTLRRVAEDMAATYDVRYLFVDDGSSDDTWQVLQQVFGGLPDTRLVRHEVNRGVAAAILTGLNAAETEIVCSIDCDCTYDPRQLAELIPKLGDDVALVTASPYHPSGRVMNVPPWRLVLSKGLSFLYRCSFTQKLHTYTSCFRVYRRSQVKDLELRESGFLGVAEMLILLDRDGKRIVEHPAVLEVRLLGHSKMKLLRTISGHLRLLGRMAITRRAPAAPPAPVPPAEPGQVPSSAKS
jgi:polysaccharide deacetylase family protein (PEP-CTERM system associated)